MRAVYFILPKRLPTVVHDPGVWIHNKECNQVKIININYVFWEKLFGSQMEKCFQNFESRERKIEYSFFKMNNGVINKFKALEDMSTYRSEKKYFNVIRSLIAYLEQKNTMQLECVFDLCSGIYINGLNYGDVKALADFSLKKGVYFRMMEIALEDVDFNTELVMMQAYSSQELLSALIAAKIIREKYPKIHICLADHGYENFSLSPYLESNKDNNLLLGVFDSVIYEKQYKDKIIIALFKALKNNLTVKGMLKENSFENEEFQYDNSSHIEIPPSCSPKPVLWLRISNFGCYWGKCSFCTQNTKHKFSEPKSSDMDSIFKRIKLFQSSGYNDFVFSDEAIPPNVLKKLSIELINRNIKINWCCRSRIETGLTPELLEIMKRSGCYEILFGLESISLQVLKKMNKYKEFPGMSAIRKIFNDMEKSGISAHINLITGFPGERPEDTEETVNFTIDVLRCMSQSSFMLNKFALYPGTPVFYKPEKYGIKIIDSEADNIEDYRFIYTEGAYTKEGLIDEYYWEFFKRLFYETGWRKFGLDSLSYAIWYMYSTTGHGAIFKSESYNIMSTSALIRENEMRSK